MTMGRSVTVRGLLVLFALCLVLPATTVIGGLVIWNVGEVRRSQESELLATARSASALVDLRMARLTTAADALATSEAVRAGDWAAARRRIERLELGPGVWIVVSDRDGAERMNAGPSGAPPLPANPRATGDGALPVVTDLIIGQPGRGVVAVRRAVPSSPAGLVVSVVASPDLLLPARADLGLPPDALVTLVDRRQRVMARSREHDRFQGVSATAPMRAAMRRQPSDVVASRSLEDRPTAVAYTRSDLTGWTTMVVLPASHLTRPILRNGAAFGLAALGLLLLGGGLSRLFGRALITELRRLENDAGSLGRGEMVAPRPGRIQNISTVQAALSDASTELDRRERRQALMINELNHRVKNTLATVQSLAAQTFRHIGGGSLETFDLRLGALAGAHDLLTRTSWEAVDIRDVMARCAASAGAGLNWTGPSAILPPHAALALCMCLHELTTNSLKYGSLSAPGGQVNVSWTAPAAGEIGFEWRETGGPPVTAPDRRGFGSRLIDRLVATELQGRIDRTYAPAGLIVQGRFAPAGAHRWRNTFD